MYPLYEETGAGLCVFSKDSVHVGPHLHRALELVYVTKGSLVLGVGRELFPLEEGELGIVFPDMIHHYQVFSQRESQGCYILAEPGLCGAFGEKLLKYSPGTPNLPRERVSVEMRNALEYLERGAGKDSVAGQAYVQILLARSMPHLKMVEKKSQGEGDLVYQVVVYLAEHFREQVCLPKMARELGVSRYLLSRVFSRTFHRNFSQYVNGLRLNYACELLEHTDQSITELSLEAGFESQRTFNRVFREQFHMTPREYRKRVWGKAL